MPTTTGHPLLAVGGSTADISRDALAAFVRDLAGEVIGTGARRVLLVPPDQTRLHSRAGEIVAQLAGLLEREVERVEVMPALGTHRPLGPADSRLMFADAIDPKRLLHHRWRDDVTTVGELPSDEVDDVVGRQLGLALPFTVNRALVDGSYDLVVSVGQVVPHEVAGFGGYTKHVAIGLGGPETIQRSHFFSAVYGIEQTLGRIDAPVRQLLDRGFDRFLEPRCRVLFALTVVEARHEGPVLRAVFAGEGGTRSSGGHAFRAAAALSARVNIETVETPFRRCVVYLDAAEYRSTWLGNKAIYRTRLAMADGGELFVVAPGVSRFGEDPLMDALIRRNGYRGRDAALQAMAADPELAANLAAVAHLIHGSTEGRFTVTYAPGPKLSRADVEGVGFGYLPLDEALDLFPPNAVDIPNPGLGLWRA
ncbi:MAG TPA: lactate racemase domain-containing protein [Gaiellaceae bacterium]|nr:lactate racemase domain-containing protein [Gaiellaceae bacterium]